MLLLPALQDLVPNTEVLRICNMNGIETFLQSAQFRLSGHSVHMNDDRTLKAVSTDNYRREHVYRRSREKIQRRSKVELETLSYRLYNGKNS